ncbi:hypothetical protein [Candidatus Colwellia aromaticivorans]|uniref:hypothetical protein n=1 Tax=Candidatus Colwellia aromaticivorans TaxID=2267621 RepID=UPI0014445051|nr:hypothetical protein [Candidatus Colwellia aromaticivorans]
MGQQAVAWGIIEINQANKIKRLKEDNTRTRYFTLNEMQKIIKQVQVALKVVVLMTDF